VIFEFNPYETVEYTLTPNTVKIPVSVVSAFKSLPKLDGSQGSNFKIWIRTEKRFLAWSELTGMVNFGKN
jgi:hypothetical protein